MTMFARATIENTDCRGNPLLPEALLVLDGETTLSDFMEVAGVSENEVFELFPWQLHPEYEIPEPGE